MFFYHASIRTPCSLTRAIIFIQFSWNLQGSFLLPILKSCSNNNYYILNLFCRMFNLGWFYQEENWTYILFEEKKVLLLSVILIFICFICLFIFSYFYLSFSVVWWSGDYEMVGWPMVKWRLCYFYRIPGDWSCTPWLENGKCS